MLSTDAVPVSPTDDDLRRLALLRGSLPARGGTPSSAALAAPPSPAGAVPVAPPARTAVPPYAAPPVTPPGVPAGVPADPKQALGGITPVDTGSTLGPRPTADLYAPKPLTGGKKALGALFAGMGAFKSPELGQQIYNQEFVAPGERGQKQFQQANTEYDKRAAEETARATQQSETRLRSAQTDLAAARTDALNNPQPKPTKEGSPELQAYDSYIAKGMTPDQAYRQVMNDAQSAKPVKPEGAPTTKTMMVNGKPMVMGWNPKTGKFDISEGEGQPNYGQQVLPTKTTQLLDASGVPTTMGWDEKTQKYDIPQGQSASGAFAHEEAQAGAVKRAGDSLIADLRNPAFSQEVGNFPAILSSVFLGTPYANPAQSQIGAEIATFAALQPAMHDLRGQKALVQFEKIIGGIPKNPEALIAAINGILKTTGAINPSLNGGGQDAGAGDKFQYATDPNGKLHRAPAGTALPTGWKKAQAPQQ